jgi:hypothetical protein
MDNNQTFRKLPLDENGKLLENNFCIESPESLIIISFPKTGKTLSMINKPNFLIGDSEKGTSYFKPKNYVNLLTFGGNEEFVKLKSGTYVPAGLFQTVDELNKANRMKEYWELKQKLEDAVVADQEAVYKDLLAHIKGMPFPIFVGDTVTSLQDLNLKAALREYNDRFPTKTKTDIKKADDFGGVGYIRANFTGIKNFVENNAAPFKVWNGHIKEKKKILRKTQDEVSAVDMALDGIVPTLFTAKADAVCTFTRDDNGCYLDFKKKEESDLGSRPYHLSNKRIKIAEPLKEGEMYPKTYWERIYPELSFE